MVMNMNTSKEEQLSAYMDDELDADSADNLVDSLKDDNSLREKWARYHLIRDIVKRETSADLAHDLAGRVATSIDSEPVILSPRRLNRKPVSSMARQVAGLAVAASITAIAILTIQGVNRETQPVENQVAVTTSGGNWIRASGTHWNVNEPSIESQLNAYIVKHNEYATSASMRGMLPYARIAGYDTDRSAQTRE